MKHKRIRNGLVVGAVAVSVIMAEKPARAQVLAGLSTLVDVAGAIANIYGAFQAGQGVAQMLGILDSNDPADGLASLHTQIDQVAGNISWFMAEADREQTIAEMVTRIRVAADDFNAGVDLSLGSNAGTDLDFTTADLVARATAGTAFLRSANDSRTNGAAVHDSMWGDFSWKTVIKYNSSDLLYQNGYVYDWRLGVPALMQLISLRIQAMAMEDPSFIQNGTFYYELMGYRGTLIDQWWTMYNGVRCGVVENDPYYDADGQAIDNNYRFWVSCADIFSGMNETKDLVYSASYPAPYPLRYDCSIRDNDGNVIDTDQACVAQRNIDFNNWYQATVQPVIDQAVLDLWNREPWYQMLAMINTLYAYANGTIDPTHGATRAIKNRANTGLCLRAQNNGTADGTPVELHNCFSTDSEKWHYDRYSESIVNVLSGLCVDVQWGSSTPATPVWTWDCNGTDAQRWTYDPEGGTFFNKLGGVLTTANWQLASGVPLLTWYDDGSDAEHWQ